MLNELTINCKNIYYFILIYEKNIGEEFQKKIFWFLKNPIQYYGIEFNQSFMTLYNN